ncbi:MAG: efflux RND transporter periplasmic adaptor subunit [Candidatus Omnitrophota bacterium]
MAVGTEKAGREKQFSVSRKNRMIAVSGVITVFLALVFFYNLVIGPEKMKGSIKVSGNVEATQVHVSFRVPGKISELFTDEGALVKKGCLLAALDTDELVKVRDEASAALKTAEYEYLNAEDDFVRAQNLFARGAISTQKRDEARTRSDTLRSRVEQMKASLALAETRLGFARLYAPLNGFITVKSSEAGEVVQAASTVFTISDLDDIWVTAYINERDLGRVRLNQDVRVKTDSYPGKTYKGNVSFISQEAEFTPKQIQTTEERVKLVYRIKIKLENRDMVFKPGMPADGYITE